MGHTLLGLRLGDGLRPFGPLPFEANRGRRKQKNDSELDVNVSKKVDSIQLEMRVRVRFNGSFPLSRKYKRRFSFSLEHLSGELMCL